MNNFIMCQTSNDPSCTNYSRSNYRNFIYFCHFNLIAEIKRTWPYVKKLFNKKTLNLKNFKYFTSIEEALKEADLVQECASENYALKTKLMSTIGKYAKPNAIISSSSSGLLPTKIYSKCKNPERAMIGHPFNPVYLLPAVEIVP